MADVVTGATGFLGSHLMARLLLSGREVIALVRRDPEAEHERIRLALTGTDHPGAADLVDRVRIVQVTLCEPELCLDRDRFRWIASEAETIWHCAASTSLNGRSDLLNRSNVIGTRAMLALAGAAAEQVHFIHVSTAFVAGGRLEGTIRESDLDDSHGFLTPYEESKYRAEQSAREWARRTGGRLTVFRPSLLLSDRAPVPGGPVHTGVRGGARLSALARRDPAVLAAGAVTDGKAIARLRGRPDATVNIVQVEYAADAMVQAATRPSGGRVDSFHLVHPQNTAIRRVAQGACRVCPWLEIRVAPEHPGDSPLARLVTHVVPGIGAYTDVRRDYDRSEITSAVTIPDPPPITDAYIDACFGPTTVSSTGTPGESATAVSSAAK